MTPTPSPSPSEALGVPAKAAPLFIEPRRRPKSPSVVLSSRVHSLHCCKFFVVDGKSQCIEMDGCQALDCYSFRLFLKGPSLEAHFECGIGALLGQLRGRCAVGVCQVGAGTVRQQQPRQRHMLAQARVVQRGLPLAVLSHQTYWSPRGDQLTLRKKGRFVWYLNICIGLESEQKLLSDIELLAIHRPMQSPDDEQKRGYDKSQATDKHAELYLTA